jgi:hypothetical protein
MRRTSAFAAASLFFIVSGRWAVAQTPPLQSYDKLEKSVTVSGLSSGGFFAHQFHIAYSGLVNGSGIIAGGPYGCARQVPFWLTANPSASTIVATGVCTRTARTSFGFWELPEAPDAKSSAEMAQTERGRDTIDDPANIAGHRVWLFSGSEDTVVLPSTMAALKALYERLGVAGPRLVMESKKAKHGLPIEEFTGESKFRKLGCLDQELPYIIDCGRDAAETLLRHLYPDHFHPHRAPRRENLVSFDQTEFFDKSDDRVSLHAVGWLYVPTRCADGAPAGAHCRLHVAFHGCEQYQDQIGDDFYWDGGYNRWAEANDIVVLYPQTRPWTSLFDPLGFTGNPKGCWDFWGYSGADYYNKRGKQMRAVRGMIGRLLNLPE